MPTAKFSSRITFNMNINSNSLMGNPARGRARHLAWFMALAGPLLSPVRAHASMFQGETLDALANGIAWVVIVVAPIIGIAIFWLIHILPEKIAEKKKHPQCGAIQCLCLLSLCFGGLLWPIAWLWAYTKPVLHKMAYGTDVDESHGQHSAEKSKSAGSEAPSGKGRA